MYLIFESYKYVNVRTFLMVVIFFSNYVLFPRESLNFGLNVLFGLESFMNVVEYYREPTNFSHL